MKSLTQRLLIFATMLFVAGMLQVAYGQGRQMMSPQARADTLGKQLGLDSATVAKVANVMVKYQKEMMDKRNELGDDREAMMAAMTELREAQTKAITALLTKEQAAKYADILKAQMQRMQNRPPRNN